MLTCKKQIRVTYLSVLNSTLLSKIICTYQTHMINALFIKLNLIKLSWKIKVSNVRIVLNSHVNKRFSCATLIKQSCKIKEYYVRSF